MSKRKIFNLILIIAAAMLYLYFTVELVLVFLRTYSKILTPENFGESLSGVVGYFTIKFVGIIEYLIVISVALVGAVCSHAFEERKSKAYFLIMIAVSILTAIANYFAYEILFQIR